jgi:LmbE family N-acetylglucosaminyl deacetylase
MRATCSVKAVACSLILGSSCTTVQAVQSQTIEERLADRSARVMFVGAHPDDETLVAPILARACIALERPCLLFIFTRGEGGRCPFKTGCWPDLGSLRAFEISRVASRYGAELELHRFWNAPLPRESFPPREAIAFRWNQSGDPVGLVASAIARFQPTILLTFDPDRGFTDHPEHALAARFAREGLARAAPPRRVNAYEVLNRFWITRLVGASDPAEPTELFDTHVPCGKPNLACLDVALEITKLHKTQARDMGLVRSLRPQMGHLYLRDVSLEWHDGEPPKP